MYNVYTYVYAHVCNAHEIMSRVVDAYIMCNGKYAEDQHSRGSKRGTPRARFFALFKVASSLPRAFSASLEGSVIQMKPAALAPEETVVS